MLRTIIRFFLQYKLVAWLILIGLIGGGLATAPFDWEIPGLPRDPVAVDAIPDLGENQQIIFTEWAGRSPQDIEDQITYPLSTTLQGIPGVKAIRASSMLGFSSIYLIFDESTDFYWSRSRILEKLNALPQGLLPDGVVPQLGPDATALGQIFWYTLEGRDVDGNPVGGWSLDELRTIQDDQVRYALAATEGVSEVASVGGFVEEYQVEVDPGALDGFGLSLAQVGNAIRQNNRDAGARTMEINQVEYLVRGIGYIQSIQDLEQTVITTRQGVPIRIGDVAHVQMGPADRRGILDKSGAEAVGGVVVARYGSNPMEVIQSVKQSIQQVSPGLPVKTLTDGAISKVTIVPFYDRTQLIRETLGTLEEALTLELLITFLVVILMLANLRAASLVSLMLPLAVLTTFIAMRLLHVDANIVALSGIAIAIGTMVDIGIIFSENLLRNRDEKSIWFSEQMEQSLMQVAPAVLTAVLTTVVSFFPVFTLEGAEGKLFRPLAWTKTFSLVSALLVSFIVMPACAHWLFKKSSERRELWWNGASTLLGTCLVVFGLSNGRPFFWQAGLVMLLLSALRVLQILVPKVPAKIFQFASLGIVALFLTNWLAREWLPLGAETNGFIQWLWVAFWVFGLLGIAWLILRSYPKILGWCLANKRQFFAIPLIFLLWGLLAWMGWNGMMTPIQWSFSKMGMQPTQWSFWQRMDHTFPGMGREFMPNLDEGDFLLMPSSMPHAGVEQNREMLAYLDLAVSAIPEVEWVVGKAGRVESALDPAPLSMYENVIHYVPEYKTDASGNRLRFQVDESGEFKRDDQGELMPDPRGRYFRQWRDHIQSPDDIWNEIYRVSQYPGLTSAPKLQPIETRLVMLQTGMRAPMGIKITGNDLETIQTFATEVSDYLKDVPGVNPPTVFADQMVGKPYLEVEFDREAAARFGVSIDLLQQTLQMSIGGMVMSETVEGRSRKSIKVRYARDFRQQPSSIGQVLVKTPKGAQIPLGELAKIEYVQGPQAIKSEQTFLVGYVLFDKLPTFAETDVVEAAQAELQSHIDSGNLKVPNGIQFAFSGTYEQQVRAEQRLSVVIPICLAIILVLLYLQFGQLSTVWMVFSGIAVAFAGGFILLWAFSQSGFLDFGLLGGNLAEIFQVKTINLSVAVWVGFIALFGIATDDGVVIATYLDQQVKGKKFSSREEIRQAILKAGGQRVRPALMTTATTLLALLPVLSSTGRGAGILVPMAIPTLGGMTIALINMYVVPVLYAWHAERAWSADNHSSEST
ncbi:efflux RND transporter permease subunit [Pontibacter sp. G13]|uniref:efflux RND transporter permease subunit n=1 Tax=Pontibacter sp. G13 TaxID=3074898 RepID=UPI00288B8E3F|nr:efflux RND transporter permease subunit [Pontibacter sp. G13]WNJ16447.1 efflux RND transporter permease subunit [Pontibacter sp. G13]